MPEATPNSAAPGASAGATAPTTVTAPSSALTGAAGAEAGGAEGGKGTASGAAAGSETKEPAKVDAKPVEGEAKKADAVPAALELKFPEGVQVDPANLEAFKTLAQAEGFTAKQAQAMADFDLARSTAAQKADQEFLAKTNSEWAEKVKAGKEYAADQQSVAKFMKRFGTPELSALFDGKGDVPGLHLGSHPALFAALASVGKALAEDTVAAPNGGAKTARNDAPSLYRDLYPNTPEFHGTR